MVTPSYYPIVGGAESLIQDLSVNLNEKGVSTDILTFNMNEKWNPLWKGELSNSNAPKVFRIPGLRLLPSSARINQRVNLIPGRFLNKVKNYDIIHFHDADDVSFPFFSHLVRKPKILHLHGFVTGFYKRHALSRFIFKISADWYISPSNLLKKDLADLLHVPSSKIIYLPNGVDTDLFSPSGKKIDNMIMFAGRVTYQKGLHVLLDSLDYLPYPVNLVIIGPPGPDLTYFENLLHRIDEENRKGRHTVQYLGVLSRQEIIEWYRKASIFVLPSLSECFPIVVIEGLSCEASVVATRVGGIPEAVYDGVNGFLVPPNDEFELAEAIRNILDNDEIRGRLRREGRRIAVEKFSIEKVVEKLCKIYEGILNKRS